MLDKPLVYIAGPITHGDTIANCALAVDVHLQLMDAGYPSICPHLSLLSHFKSTRTHEQWLELDFALLRRCDVVVRLPGESEGSDREVEFAESIGIPVIEPLTAGRAVNDVMTWEGQQHAIHTC